MKKIILLAVLSSFLLYSCNSSMDVTAQKGLIGTWTLDNVSYSESLVKVTAFGEYDAQCLRNSSWFFVANNNSGTFTLNASGCPAVTQNFTWYIDPQGMFVLKRLNEGDKARKVTEGTVYQFSNPSTDTFTLRQVISGVTVTYHFTKVSNKKV